MTIQASHPSKHCSGGLRAGGSVDIPQPPPDTVPMPPSPHPVPPPIDVPPEINDPALPGTDVPVREPTNPGAPVRTWH